MRYDLDVDFSSSLGEKQELFAWALGKLITYAYSRGYRIRIGDVHRPDRKGHMPGSLHYIKLAADLNLFIDNWYISTYYQSPEAWDDLGAYWKQLHHLCTWGGDFGDYNHFSVTHGGKK